jgi:hypothetical protein
MQDNLGNELPTDSASVLAEKRQDKALESSTYAPIR